MDAEQLKRNLKHHTPSEGIAQDIETLRTEAAKMADAISILVPDGRAQSLAQTKLEECVMWAVKGMVVPGA